ncbi:putative ferric-chelate reductase 1 [Mixophyes fleayi]|uniref:putative ferric-chelate reductase 1 n=1 Tax=Mixophyes fleayi TaxID=3061075 RepID=UPI003F4D73DF
MVLPFRSIVITVAVLFPLHVAAYPNGLVEVACSDMVPQHGFAIQTTTAPYTITMSKHTYVAKEKITVTLTNTSAEYPIEGFLIQARQENSNTPLGSFQISGSDVQTLTCTTAAGAVSHTSDHAKSVVQVTWVAPSSNISNIQLRATVVRNGSIYWTNVVGPSLTYVGSGGSQMLVCKASVTIMCISILVNAILSPRF